jgi:hypothetical protein
VAGEGAKLLGAYTRRGQESPCHQTSHQESIMGKGNKTPKKNVKKPKQDKAPKK